MLRNRLMVSLLAIALSASACATRPVPVAQPADLGPLDPGFVPPHKPAPPSSDVADVVRIGLGLACTGGIAAIGVVLVSPGAWGAAPMCW